MRVVVVVVLLVGCFFSEAVSVYLSNVRSNTFECKVMLERFFLPNLLSPPSPLTGNFEIELFKSIEDCLSRLARSGGHISSSSAKASSSTSGSGFTCRLQKLKREFSFKKNFVVLNNQ